jgi:translation elongation factor EF-Tu-like GTPase
MTGRRFAAFIEAEVHLLTPDEGGRRSPIASGYRCNCWVGHINDGHRVYNDATIHLLGRDKLTPGATARARVEPHFPDDWSHLAVGSSFELCEGPRVIGVATVTGLFPPS